MLKSRLYFNYYLRRNKDCLLRLCSQELDDCSLYHFCSIETESSQCHYVLMSNQFRASLSRRYNVLFDINLMLFYLKAYYRVVKKPKVLRLKYNKLSVNIWLHILRFNRQGQGNEQPASKIGRCDPAELLFPGS